MDPPHGLDPSSSMNVSTTSSVNSSGRLLTASPPPRLNLSTTDGRGGDRPTPQLLSPDSPSGSRSGYLSPSGIGYSAGPSGLLSPGLQELAREAESSSPAGSVHGASTPSREPDSGAASEASSRFSVTVEEKERARAFAEGYKLGRQSNNLLRKESARRKERDGKGGRKGRGGKGKEETNFEASDFDETRTRMKTVQRVAAAVTRVVEGLDTSDGGEEGNDSTIVTEDGIREEEHWQASSPVYSGGGVSPSQPVGSPASRAIGPTESSTIREYETLHGSPHNSPTARSPPLGYRAPTSPLGRQGYGRQARNAGSPHSAGLHLSPPGAGTEGKRGGSGRGVEGKGEVGEGRADSGSVGGGGYARMQPMASARDHPALGVRPSPSDAMVPHSAAGRETRGPSSSTSRVPLAVSPNIYMPVIAEWLNR